MKIVEFIVRIREVIVVKNNTKMIIHVDLGQDFVETIRKDMEQAFDEAVKKWGVFVNFKQKEAIFTHSIRQVQAKTSENAKNNWDLSDHLTIRAISVRSGIEISLPSPEAANVKTKLFYTRDGWEVDQENNEESVALNDFADYIRNKIRTWVRTAVFYGVGSYAQ